MESKHHDIACRFGERIRLFLTNPEDPQAFKPGDKLPTLEQVAADEGCSKDTVRKAYGTLEDEGLVTIGSGKHGTIVREIANFVMISVPGHASPLWSEQHPDGRDELVEANWSSVDPETAAILGIEPGAAVVERMRYRYIGTERVAIHRTWVPGDVATKIKEATGFDIGDLPNTPKTDLYSLFELAGYELRDNAEDFQATTAVPEDRRTLDLPKRRPVQAISRVTWDVDGKVLEHSRIVNTGDRAVSRFVSSLAGRPAPQLHPDDRAQG